MSLFIIFESLIKLTIKFTDRTRECERFGHEVFFPKLMCLVTYKEVFFFFFEECFMDLWESGKIY